MRVRVLIGITLLVLLAVPAAFSQAAAESILLNSNSAAATAKAGTSLGNSLNSAGGKLGGQIQNIPQSKSATHSGVVVHRTQTASQTRQVAQTKNPPPVGAKPASGGSMITSVQGGRVTRPPQATPVAPQK
jgi:hypothetical protein